MDAPLLFSRHARDRMVYWHLDVADVRVALESGETIEEYEDGSRLVFGRSGIRPVHVVVRSDEAMDFVITTYEPDPSRWDATFRHRIGP